MARLIELVKSIIPRYSLRTLLVGTTLFACSLSAWKMLDERKPVLFYDFENDGKLEAICLEETDGKNQFFSVADSYSIDPLTGKIVSFGKRKSIGCIDMELTKGEKTYSVEEMVEPGTLNFVVRGRKNNSINVGYMDILYPHEIKYNTSYYFTETN